ncbi:hypothetical protein H0O02_03150 [Candidatus Micrarchaeota archaeon]|nr:hypothetical protein [Candidatus Micrarchaeota archaeon]
MNRLYDGNCRIITEQIESLRKYKNAGKLIGTYRTLIERQYDGARKELAIKKGSAIISVFEFQLNPAARGSNDVFDSRVAENAVRALELFGRLIENLPEESVADDYIRMVVAIGDNAMGNMRAENALSIAGASFDIIGSWNSWKLENTMARLQMLEWSICRATSVIGHLNANTMPEFDEDGAWKLHPERNGIIASYLNRGIHALGEEGDLEKFSIIQNLFKKLDCEIERLVESHKRKDGIVQFIIDMNERISISIAGQNPPVPRMVEALIMTGIRGIGTLLEMKGIPADRMEKAN